jgi:hypothetical protein
MHMYICINFKISLFRLLHFTAIQFRLFYLITLWYVIPISVSHVVYVAYVGCCVFIVLQRGTWGLCRILPPTFHFPRKPASQFPASLIRVQYIIHYIWNRQETNRTAFLPTQPNTCTPKICTQWLNIMGTGNAINVMYRALMFPDINGTNLQDSSPSCGIALRQDTFFFFFFFFANVRSNGTLSFYGCYIWCSTVVISSVSAVLIFALRLLTCYN